jgi:RNA polymerase sigma-70 factor (ECF subfamily)
MPAWTNEDWLRALSEGPGEMRSEALEALRAYLLRAVLVYLARHRSELRAWSQQALFDLAQDLAQESLLEIQANLGSFKGESKFTTWAYRVVINQAASELRRHRYRNLSLDQLQEEQPVVFQSLMAEVDEAGARVSPETVAERRLYLNLLNDIVQRELNERQRAAVVGVHWLGLSMDEVAASLGLSRNALYKLLHDARQKIKAQLLARRLSEGDILAAFEEGS